MTLANKLEVLVGRTSDAADAVREQVRIDVGNWLTPVVRDEAAWRDWLCKELGRRGFAAMSIQCRSKAVSLRRLAMALAFEVLWEIGGVEAPLLSVPAVLEGENSLVYWRAVAIAHEAERAGAP